MTKEEAECRIKAIQNGSGLDKESFPDNMKGKLAEDLWNDETFSYGMEYGYVLAMLDISDNRNSTEIQT